MDEPTTERLTSFLLAEQGKETRTPCLIALKGPEKGATFPLEPGMRVLGRSGDKADIVLMGSGISRAHAQISVSADGELSVEDLRSTNGVFLNGQKVEKAALRAGDTLALGPEVVLRLEIPDSLFQEVFEDMYRGATLDGLTGVLNRKSFMSRLTEEHAAGKRHGYPSCVAMLDVDHFKAVNDGYGHPAGDAVLVKMAALIANELRTEDMVGRFGGEEFVLFLRYATAEAAAGALERLREVVAAHEFKVPHQDGGETAIRITCSMGVAKITPDNSIEEGIANADEALYAAKRNGRNRICREGQIVP